MIFPHKNKHENKSTGEINLLAILREKGKRPDATNKSHEVFIYFLDFKNDGQTVIAVL